MLAWYVAYVTFMKFNERIESLVKRLLFSNKVDADLQQQQQAQDANNNAADMLSDETPSLPLPAKDSLHSAHNFQVEIC